MGRECRNPGRRLRVCLAGCDLEEAAEEATEAGRRGSLQVKESERKARRSTYEAGRVRRSLRERRGQKEMSSC
jgi:hypothetical protein